MQLSAEFEEEKCEIVPSLQTLTTNHGSSMFASNMSMGGVEEGWSPHQQLSSVNEEEKRLVTFSDQHDSSEATYQSPSKPVSKEGQMQYADAERGPWGQKEEEKCEVVAIPPNPSHTTHQRSPTHTSNSPEVEEEKCEIAPSLQTLTTNKGPSMYASNIPLGDVEEGGLQKSQVTFSDQHNSSEETYQSPLKHVSNEGQMQFEDAEIAPSGEKEEEKCEVAVSQPNSSHTTHQSSPAHTSNRDDSI